MEKKSPAINIHVTEEMHEELRIASFKMRRSISELVREAISAHLAKINK